MNARWDFLSLLTLAVTVAAPAAGQPAASTPDVSGPWSNAALNGLELPLSGPGPVRNRRVCALDRKPASATGPNW